MDYKDLTKNHVVKCKMQETPIDVKYISRKDRRPFLDKLVEIGAAENHSEGYIMICQDVTYESLFIDNTVISKLMKKGHVISTRTFKIQNRIYFHGQ